MRRKPLIILSCILIVTATVTAEVSFNSNPVQLPNGYRVQLVESTVLIERPAPLSIPLNWIGYGLAFLIMMYCLLRMLFEKDRPRGFDVRPPSE